MRDQTIIGRYLREVDAYLHLDRRRRRRVLEEIEGHVHDAVDAHVACGVHRDVAVERAVQQLGVPAAVAMEFSGDESPWRSVRGWRRWAPMVAPAVLLAIAVSLMASTLSWVRGGLTLGERTVLISYTWHAAIVGALAAATYSAVRRADRQPGWRRAAWFCAVVTILIVVVLGG